MKTPVFISQTRRRNIVPSYMLSLKIKVVFAVLFMLAIAGGGFYYFRNKTANILAPHKSGTNDGEIVNVVNTNNSSENKTEDNTKPKDQLPALVKTETLHIPSLDSKIIIPDSFGADGKRLMLDRFSKVIAALRKTPDSLEDWLTLGVLKSQVNDYLGAKEIWEYLIKAFPKNPTAYGNLASLYAFDLKDASKAEAAFKKALAVAPDQLQTYRNFAEFYIFILKDTGKAKEILQLGIEKNLVNSSSLQKLLDDLSKK